MSLRLLGGFVAATVLCALLDLPLDRMLLMPLLIGVVLALCVSMTVGVEEAVSKLYGVALGLLAAIVAFSGIKAQVKALLGDIPPFLVAGGLLLGGLLMVIAKAREGGKETGRRSRPSLRMRAPTIIEPEAPDANALTNFRASTADDQQDEPDDDFGLFRGGKRHGP